MTVDFRRVTLRIGMGADRTRASGAAFATARNEPEPILAQDAGSFP